MFDLPVSEPLSISDEDTFDGRREPTVEADAAERLRRAGLSATRQRLDLMELLFTTRYRHVTAGELCREAARAGKRMSLATVYNTLNQFATAGPAAAGRGGTGEGLFRHQRGRSRSLLH